MMAFLTQRSRSAHRQPRQDLLTRIVDWLAGARERSRQRRALAALSEDQLRDIGLSRSDVAAEGTKPFWRA
ncbi:DUF1127 domain-containing protein [Dongia sp.]|uniref:DUF1127 domain-containing protein n=1 Tax=Dongia sp. TaxID=1977262 RepID=UPI0035B2246C